jgi:two-component system sensor histidine kinase RegB
MTNSPKIKWLIRLRWVAAAVQALLIAGAAALPSLHIELPQLAGVLLVSVGTNAGLHLARTRGHTLPELVVPAILGLDIGLLTVGLWLSGGPMNPFSFLYVFYVAVAAVVTSRGWSWVLSILAVFGYGLLYVVSGPGHHDEAMSMHLNGMWIAMTVTAGLIIYFVSMLQQSLADQERELARIRANQQRLGSLTAMAAGAAHELATPLATIALTSNELARELDATGSDDLAADAQLIRTQVDRCRSVLDRMAADAGQPSGQPMDDVSARQLVDDALESVSDSNRIDVAIDDDPRLEAPIELLAEVLGSLMQNALDATSSEQRVRITAAPDESGVSFEVSDAGVGMTAEEIRRASEPFYTTKDSRERMGLGLYVAQQLATDLGGALDIDSSPGGGTRVRLWLPTHAHGVDDVRRQPHGRHNERD